MAVAPGTKQGQPSSIRRSHTWAQRIGGLLIAATIGAAVAWYVPRVVSTDEQLLTGEVASGGAVTLNFSRAGTINKINVRPGQKVRKGQVLATEAAPDATAVVKNELAAITADKARTEQIKAAQAAGLPGAKAAGPQLAAANAELALDEARLTADKAKMAGTRIIAPAAGTVVATNGQPGQAVTASGIKDYASDSHRSSPSQRPAFSLLPEGPQPLRPASPQASTLPVISLRTSAVWNVVALIPENSISKIASGRLVTISVPAADIKDVRAKVDQLVSSPITTAQGTAYQAVIKVTGHVSNQPLNGMAVDVRLGS